ncbi:FAD binding domain-containing protein [Diaporthe helianthi]|uniref:FAD binding domain-containing protein n=1 Tax=Diaporthe helianthi TaxID=158607 RepID=A0A2P5HGZ3_DIAHE|nr:FAD binding domain-containing protein [Diaporthe helianthi]
MLHLAGIDYRLYDKRENLCERHVAGLAIQLQKCRVLEQLGIFDQVLRRVLAPEMQVHREVSADRNILADHPFFQWLKESHGYNMMLFERWQYIKLLYDTPQVYQTTWASNPGFHRQDTRIPLEDFECKAQGFKDIKVEKLAVLEEGVATSYEMALGESTHGANIGLESAAGLVDRLRSLLSLNPYPTKTQLEKVFRVDQKDTAPVAVAYLKPTYVR